MNFYDACWGGTEMTKAARFGQLETLIWLQSNTVRLGPQRLLIHAARHLSSDVLNWVMDTRGDKPELCDFVVAVQNGRPENVEIMASRTQTLPRIPAHHAARNGHLHVLQWMDQNDGVFTHETMDSAAELLSASHGSCRREWSPQCHRWLVENYIEQVAIDALQLAVKAGQTKVAQWLYKEIDADWTGNLVECASCQGSRELVPWTLKVYPNQYTSAVMDNAALANNRELFFALHYAGKACTTDAIDHFASRGDLTMLRWAFRVRREACSSDAMDRAATNGHLDVVKFLHDRRQPCTTQAMDGAAASGHLHVLEWLHAHCSERFSVEAMDEEARRGHIAVVKWLHEHGGTCTEYAMDAAAAQGHFGVVVFLHSERHEVHQSGQLTMVTWRFSSGLVSNTRASSTSLRPSAQLLSTDGEMNTFKTCATSEHVHSRNNSSAIASQASTSTA